MKICAKGVKDNTPWQLRRIGGSRYMCCKPLDHTGDCGEWMFVCQPDHAEAMATHEHPHAKQTEALEAHFKALKPDEVKDGSTPSGSSEPV